MRIVWQILWLGELPLRDADTTLRVWKPGKGWLVPDNTHVVILLSSIHVREARQWIRKRAKQLDTTEGSLLVYVRDPRIMKGGNFVRKKVQGHYELVTAPFEVVGYDDYIEIGLMYEPAGFEPFGDEHAPHPKLEGFIEAP